MGDCHLNVAWLCLSLGSTVKDGRPMSVTLEMYTDNDVYDLSMTPHTSRVFELFDRRGELYNCWLAAPITVLTCEG